jgi:hypothetical protein
MTEYLVTSGDDLSFWVQIEPEGMVYEIQPNQHVLLSFRPRDYTTQHVELVHLRDGLSIWRPGDTAVFATTSDGAVEQIAGWADNPAPWIDSGSPLESPPPWVWPPDTRADR